MFTFISRGPLVPAMAIIVITTLSNSPATAAWQTVLDEDFATDPIGTRANVDPAADAGRFTYNSGSQSLSAAYDTMQTTSKLFWQLPGGQTLTEQDAFRVNTTFTIDSINGVFNEFAQVAFGLINTTTTGDDRAGGTFDDSQGAYDIVTVDYFPNLSDFAAPTLGVTVNETNVGQGYLAEFDADFNIIDEGAINFPFGPETDLGDESTLPEDQSLTAEMEYDPTTRSVTLTINDLPINLVGTGDGVGDSGGPDDNTMTIQTFLRPDSTFEVDGFALTLWEDTFRSDPDTASTTGTLTFDAFSVETQAIPEPTTAACLVISALMMIGRRRR